MMRPPLKRTLFAYIARPRYHDMIFSHSDMIFSHNENKAVNETLTMHINVAVAQAVGNLTQRSHEKVDQMHKQ